MNSFTRFLGAIGAGVILMGTSDAIAQDAATKTFSSYQAAAAALVSAVEANDGAAEKEILGAEAPALLASGDSSADEDSRKTFLKHYREAHIFIRESKDRVSLRVGSTGWALPFPMIRTNGKWHFDPVAGAQELTYRRIGQNELDAMRVCRALYSAQLAYAMVPHDGNPAGTYARRFMSHAGMQDGLYWDAKEGEAESPAGSLVAEAAAESDESTNTIGRRTPFHGYFYRILKAQGTHAPGGAKDYLRDGKMTGGFAILAYPAEYQASGVMSFVIDARGRLYQKDLGKPSDDVDSRVAIFDPDPTWTAIR